MPTTSTGRGLAGHGRLVAAAGLFLGSLLWIASSAVSPAYADDTAAYLREVAASPNRHVASALLFLAGSVLLFPGLLATARLLRGPRGLVGQAGAYLLAVGALVAGGLMLAVNSIEVATTEVGLSDAQMVALSDRGEESTGALIGFVAVFFGGFVVGLALLGIGLALRRAVPVPVAALVVAPVVLLFAVGDRRAGSVAGIAVLAAGFAGVAWRLLSLTDEQWTRRQPLPDGGTRTTQELSPASSG